MTLSPLSPNEIDAIRLRHAAKRHQLGASSVIPERDDIAALLAHIDHLEEQLKIRSPHFTGEADPDNRGSDT